MANCKHVRYTDSWMYTNVHTCATINPDQGKEYTCHLRKSPCAVFSQILPWLLTYSDFYNDRLLLSIIILHLKWNTWILLCLFFLVSDFFNIMLLRFTCITSCIKIYFSKNCWLSVYTIACPYFYKWAFEWFPGFG